MVMSSEEKFMDGRFGQVCSGLLGMCSLKKCGNPQTSSAHVCKEVLLNILSTPLVSRVLVMPLVPQRKQ